MELEHFRLTVADGIATVVFDRPPVNAQNQKTREEFIRLFDALGDRDDVRVVVLTGNGDMSVSYTHLTLPTIYSV